ncbi:MULTISPECIES: MarR family winged helix-turn-helix transcriptional regulator [Methanobacterium]|jgi:DNA-binding MarR family transcriptional regulator|uniref:MarR family transcriptional regulator n=1 Tax=Methanobacterium formicicum TaxID=2162 RepID=A0A089ZIV9_METFO|nr:MULTISPECIES: MarR family transcriptional regulator [Methanobacterium]AIS32848.1 MarR family transcriptional regulator [Methanobacterium formicicum]KUK72839.1 MAG: MarR family transcriptional regulator [Methanobacterium sp. 42_16]MBF4474258.1 MarR family transcriptional regulator [Methanobacterium formicicum]MDD4811530.1 MarR family transcriptional regulator [Methanobacterium formicicum]MDG3546756.1 MarR family transcriptional regulator [Methanobacterium formicicum]
MDDDDLRIIVELFDDIGDKILKTAEITLKSYENLTIAEANALYVIGPQEPKTMKQIAEALGVAVSTPTRTIDRLVEKGLVTRTVAKKDRRKLLIELTPEGKDLLERMDEEGILMARKMFENLQDEEIASLKKILLKISEKL